MKFQGKIGLWWYIVLLAINTVFIKAMISPDKTGGRAGLTIVVLLCAVCDIFMFHITLKNYIILDKDELIIFFGPLKQKIQYKDIISLKPTHNPLSSMALSLDRIAIYWKRGGVLVAVKNKQAFMEQVSLKNSDINVLDYYN